MNNNPFKILDWDSGFFGFKIAKISAFEHYDNLLEIISDLKKENVKLIYLIADPTDTDRNIEISRTGAQLVDEKITYRINTCSAKYIQNRFIEKYAESQPNEKLIDIALQTSMYSRYRIDKRFGNEACNKLYETWICNAINASFDDCLYVYKEQSNILGLITLKTLNANLGSIGLIGVDNNSRGKKIGYQLIQKAIGHFSESNIFRISVATQKANTLACRFYEKNGFEIFNVQNFYHLWL